MLMYLNCSYFSSSQFYYSLQSGLGGKGDAHWQFCLALEKPWTQLSSSTKWNKQKSPTSKKKKQKQQEQTKHLQAEMAVSRKYLEGVRGLLCSSEYLMRNVIFLTKWAPGAQKSEPRLLPCFLQESILASTNPCLAHRIWFTIGFGNGVIGT